MILRIALCFQVPEVTTDTYRNLGYASHAFDAGVSIYSTTPRNFAPEPWHRNWPDVGYLYPPAVLLFFYSFSIFGAGIFWVKLVLTIIEVFCAYLFRKRISELAGILYFCSPVSIWYASHEGQFEPLQVLFILLTVEAIGSRRWGMAGLLFALSIQVKQFGVLLFPWVAYELWQSSENVRDRLKAATLLGLGFSTGFLLFLRFYRQKPDLLISALAAPGVFSPYAWDFTNPGLFGWTPPWLVIWNSLFTYAIVVCLLIAMVKYLREETAILAEGTPLLSFWFVLKSLVLAAPWYAMVGFAFVSCLAKKRGLALLLLLLSVLQPAESLSQLIGHELGPHESAATIAVMRQCLFACRF